MDWDRPFVLGRDSAVFLKTVSGQVIFLVGERGDDVTTRALRMARIAEGIEVDPGQGAPLSESGIAQVAIGLSAWQRIQDAAQRAQ